MDFEISLQVNIREVGYISNRSARAGGRADRVDRADRLALPARPTAIFARGYGYQGTRWWVR
jgi:hypothetical protein